MKRLLLAFVGILLITALATTGKAWDFAPEFPMSQENGYSLNQYDGGFDRQACEEYCRSRYGLLPYAAGGGGGSDSGRGKFYLFAQCMAYCDRKFWKEFDRNMRKLEEE